MYTTNCTIHNTELHVHRVCTEKKDIIFKQVSKYLPNLTYNFCKMQKFGYILTFFKVI